MELQKKVATETCSSPVLSLKPFAYRFQYRMPSRAQQKKRNFVDRQQARRVALISGIPAENALSRRATKKLLKTTNAPHTALKPTASSSHNYSLDAIYADSLAETLPNIGSTLSHTTSNKRTIIVLHPESPL